MANEGVSDEIAKLMMTAKQARHNAYCPYSNFRVGAAVLSTEGQIFSGVNVENACFGLTVCAERVAIMTAVSAGCQSFKAIAVCCDIKGSFKTSCGACRQFIAEFGLDLDLYMVKPDGSWQKENLEKLLPNAFTPKSLKEERITS